MSVNNLHDSKSRVAICSLVGYVTIRYYICMIQFRDDYISYFKKTLSKFKRGLNNFHKRNYFKSRNRFLVFWLDILLTL